MDTKKFEQLTDYTSAGYALAKDLHTGRVCVMEGDCAIYTSEYADLWYEYPQGTWQRPLVWAAPDRLAFFRNRLLGTARPRRSYRYSRRVSNHCQLQGIRVLHPPR